MRVVVNASCTIGNKTGVGRHTAELIECLDRIMSSGELHTHPHSWMRNLLRKWRRFSGAKPKARTLLPSPRRLALRAVGAAGRGILRLYDKAVLRANRFDLYHEPNFIPVPCDIPTLATFHDLSLLRYPEWHPAERVKRFEANLARTLRQTSHFFTVTESARQEMVELLDVPAHKITCTYNGVRSDLTELPREVYRPVLQKLDLPEGYLLHVGTIEPRKNLLRLMQAYVDLPATVREKHPLVLAGQWGWRFEEIAEFYHATGKHKGVRQIGFVADEDLPALYNGARALVFPTHYEGFGIPAVEMLGCGGAVLASATAAVAEVVGPHADIVHPEDLEGWREAMLRVLTDDHWWRSLREGGVAWANRFTWERCADQTLGVYRQLMGVPEPIPAPVAKAA